MSGENHGPTHEPARTIYWIGKGRCPDCIQGRERPQLDADGTCPFCGWSE